MTLSPSQSRLLTWVDEFLFTHYRPPCIVEAVEAKLYPNLYLAVVDRRALIDAGRLVRFEMDTADVNSYLVPDWVKPFVDLQAKEGRRIKGIIKAISQKGTRTNGPS